ncbi:hypothetical protein [Gryllotalpicola sp.]|uniref:hypothetical protein n=1 Tax=Gryllotalpicola sp. TaxID=1932787 RepID=UPI002614EEF5|nr:hypothetical protein [Gryllotalpicola sp.]
MNKSVARTRRLATLLVGPTAILVAGLLVWQGSSAAFTATTRNTGNNWETGSVLLSDDDLGAAAFRVTGVTPGQTGSKCLVVTSDSTVPGEVRMYIDTVGAQGLENNITMSIQIGAGGSFSDCTGFAPSSTLPATSLAALGASTNNYTTGVLPWATAGTPRETKTYKATWTFDVTALT